jgi:hypothetical protein
MPKTRTRQRWQSLELGSFFNSRRVGDGIDVSGGNGDEKSAVGKSKSGFRDSSIDYETAVNNWREAHGIERKDVGSISDHGGVRESLAKATAEVDDHKGLPRGKKEMIKHPPLITEGKIKHDGKVYPIIPPHEEFDLNGGTKLEDTKKLKSVYEKGAAEVLFGMKLDVLYEQLMLRIDEADVWDPDFFINLTVDGKQVAIETHNLYFPDENGEYVGVVANRTVDNYLDRMGRFLLGHGERVYLILVDSHIMDGTEPYVELDVRGDAGKCVDEHWHMQRLVYNNHVLDQKSYESWMDWFRHFLTDLIENRADK